MQSRLGIANYVVCYKNDIDAYSIEFNAKPLYRFPACDFFKQIKKYLKAELTPVCKGTDKSWVPFFCETNGVFNINFDLFAAVFYLIARIDELLPNAQKDKHGRFLTQSCIQYKFNAHRVPVIDYWILDVRNCFETRSIETTKEHFEWWNTIDIDQARAAVGKPIIKRVANLLRKLGQLKFGEFKLLFDTFYGKSDPFDVLANMHSTKSRDIVFYLVAGNSPYDFGSLRNNDVIESDIKKCKQRFEVGLHPSYNSYDQLSLINHEKEIIGKYQGVDVAFSRQHYLRYNWPNTPHALQKAGLTHDFTMGLANDIGFRAGTSRPFAFYNVLHSKEYSLLIVPFAVMDVTLKNYLQVGIEESKQLIDELIEHAQNTNGLFTSLWHNESMSQIDGWKGWHTVYNHIKNKLTE